MGQKKLHSDFTLQVPEKIRASIRMASNELTEEFCQDIIFPFHDALLSQKDLMCEVMSCHISPRFRLNDFFLAFSGAEFIHFGVMNECRKYLSVTKDSGRFSTLWVEEIWPMNLESGG